ncbi:unnamed protein product, partial [Heterotrigona itama]
ISILSSMHSSVEIEKNDSRIPETIEFDNNIKFDVNAIALQMARKYYIKSKSRK